MLHTKGFFLSLAWSLSFLGLGASVAQAKEIRWTHFGLRPLGMGNAYVAVADDYNALFYNPAGLARLKTWDGEFFNPTLEAAQRTLSFIDSAMKLQGTSLQETSDVLDLFKEQAGKYHHLASYMTPHLIFPHGGFGLGLALPFSLVVHRNINVAFDAGLRLIAPIAVAFNFLEDRLSLGVSVKVLARAGVDHTFALDTIEAFKDEKSLQELFEAGVGYGVDAGLLFTPIKPMEPTLGVSIADIGGSTYQVLDVSKGKARPPANRLPAVNTGVSFKPYQSQRMYVLAAVDAHAINQPVHYGHKFNGGLEWGFGDLLKVQTGLKEGYATAGFQIDVGLLNLRFSTYAVDHGAVVGSHENLVERRYAVQLKLLI